MNSQLLRSELTRRLVELESECVNLRLRIKEIEEVKDADNNL